MTNFEFLQRYDPKGRTAWFTLPIEVPAGWDPARLELMHAGASNRPYAEAVANKNAKKTYGVGASAILGAHGEGLMTDRELFPLHVITGWENVPERAPDGAFVQSVFSQAKCIELLSPPPNGLPDWIVERLSNFASIEPNFLPDGYPDENEVRAHAGN